MPKNQTKHNLKKSLNKHDALVIVYGNDIDFPTYSELVELIDSCEKNGHRIILIPEPNEQGKPTDHTGQELDMSDFSRVDVLRTLEKYFSVGGEKQLKNKNYTVIVDAHGNQDRTRDIASNPIKSLSHQSVKTLELYKIFLTQGKCEGIYDMACYGGLGMLDLKQAMEETKTSRPIHFFSHASSFQSTPQVSSKKIYSAIKEKSYEGQFLNKISLIIPHAPMYEMDCLIETKFDGSNIDKSGNIKYKNYRKYLSENYISGIESELVQMCKPPVTAECAPLNITFNEFVEAAFKSKNLPNLLSKIQTDYPYNSFTNQHMSEYGLSITGHGYRDGYDFNDSTLNSVEQEVILSVDFFNEGKNSITGSDRLLRLQRSAIVDHFRLHKTAEFVLEHSGYLYRAFSGYKEDKKAINDLVIDAFNIVYSKEHNGAKALIEFMKSCENTPPLLKEGFDYVKQKLCEYKDFNFTIFQDKNIANFFQKDEASKEVVFVNALKNSSLFYLLSEVKFSINKHNSGNDYRDDFLINVAYAINKSPEMEKDIEIYLPKVNRHTNGEFKNVSVEVIKETASKIQAERDAKARIELERMIARERMKPASMLYFAGDVNVGDRIYSGFWHEGPQERARGITDFSFINENVIVRIASLPEIISEKKPENKNNQPFTQSTFPNSQLKEELDKIILDAAYKLNPKK